MSRLNEGAASMSFIDHLMELRRRLWICVVAVVVCVILALSFYQPIFTFFRQPLDELNAEYARSPEMFAQFEELRKTLKLEPGDPAAMAAVLAQGPVVRLINTSLLGTMTNILWLGVYAGLLLSSPILVFELWAFIAPGLRETERRAIRPIFAGGILFFLLGAAAAYYILFPTSLRFFVWLDLYMGIQPMYTVNDYLGMILLMMIIAGLLCEAPLVVAVLAKIGLIGPEHLTQYWRAILLGIAVAGAAFSPGTDVISMLLFSALLLLLYIVSIVMAYVFAKRAPKPSA